MNVLVSFDNQDEGNGITHKRIKREGKRTDVFEGFEMWIIFLYRHCQDTIFLNFILCQSPELL